MRLITFATPLVLALAALACGSESSDAGGTEADDGLGSKVSVPSFRSVPEAELDLRVDEAANGLIVTNAFLLNATFATTPYFEWYGTVVNESDHVVCKPSGIVALLDESGEVLFGSADYVAAVHAAPYQVAGVSETIPCLAPGETGVLFTNSPVVDPSYLGAITRIRIQLSGELLEGAAPHPHPPTISITGTGPYASGESNVWSYQGSFVAHTHMASTDIDCFGQSAGYFASWASSFVVDATPEQTTVFENLSYMGPVPVQNTICFAAWQDAP